MFRGREKRKGPGMLESTSADPARYHSMATPTTQRDHASKLSPSKQKNEPVSMMGRKPKKKGENHKSKRDSIRDMFPIVFRKKDLEDIDEDPLVAKLSYAGKAMYSALNSDFKQYRHDCWNVTKSKVVGELLITPFDFATREGHIDPKPGHDDWFAHKVGHMIAKTEQWCDITSLELPDGVFMEAFKDALHMLCHNDHQLRGRVTIRILFGNILLAPVDCKKFLKEVTKDLPANAGEKIKLWVGSWRKGTSWNHSKIIAVDGKYLITGGHNLYHEHYLSKHPVNDVSLELEGPVANDAHMFANRQWGFIFNKMESETTNLATNILNSYMDVGYRVSIAQFPKDTASTFAPTYKKIRRQTVLMRDPIRRSDIGYVPIISIGRYGSLLSRKKDRPADYALLAMFDAAKVSIRCAIQDLGPIMLIPGSKIILPTLRWPRKRLRALARAVYERDVQVELVFSNPGSMPGSKEVEQVYANGWSCNFVAMKIIRKIVGQFPDAPFQKIEQKVRDNLRVCYIRNPVGGRYYESGRTLGLHSKFYMVDDRTCYIGSQNLYVCDLAEWGIVVDDPDQVQKFREQYWDPLWEVSYREEDFKVEKVLSRVENAKDVAYESEETALLWARPERTRRGAIKGMDPLKMEHLEHELGCDSDGAESADNIEFESKGDAAFQPSTENSEGRSSCLWV